MFKLRFAIYKLCKLAKCVEHIYSSIKHEVGMAVQKSAKKDSRDDKRYDRIHSSFLKTELEKWGVPHPIFYHPLYPCFSTFFFSYFLIVFLYFDCH